MVLCTSSEEVRPHVAQHPKHVVVSTLWVRDRGSSDAQRFQGQASMTTTYPKDSMYKCPECLRHFMGDSAMRRYEGLCNMCGTHVDREEDRVK